MVVVVDPFSAVLDCVSIAAFSYGIFIGVRNYKKTKGLSNYWLLFSVTGVIGIAFTITFLFQHLNIYAAVFDVFDVPLLVAFITAFIMTVISAVTSPINVTIE